MLAPLLVGVRCSKDIENNLLSGVFIFISSFTYATTAISQFAGQNNKIFTDDLNIEWFQYVGSNIETTREFCEHLTKKEFVHKSEIPTILSGLIDKHQCEIYEKTGLPRGMIDGTNEENFQVYCGGWNCRHQLVPVAKEAVPKEIRERFENARHNAKVKEAEVEAERLRASGDYKDVATNDKGGLKATHKGHIDHNNGKEEKFFNGLTSTDLEKECQDNIFRMGHRGILLNESVQSKKGENDTALDLNLDGKIMDIASVTKEVVDYRNIIWYKSKQLHRYNNLDYVSEKANSLCMYFHDSQLYSSQKVIDGMERLKRHKYIDKTTGEEKYVNIAIEHIYCVVNGADDIYRFDF